MVEMGRAQVAHRGVARHELVHNHLRLHQLLRVSADSGQRTDTEQQQVISGREWTQRRIHWQIRKGMLQRQLGRRESQREGLGWEQPCARLRAHDALIGALEDHLLPLPGSEEDGAERPLACATRFDPQIHRNTQIHVRICIKICSLRGHKAGRP